MDFASLLGGIVSFASNLYGTMYGADRADEDRALTLDLFNKSREFQLQDQGWTEDVSKRLMNYQYNKFSSPSAQMQAYKDANLNPWLMMQGGSVGSGQGVSVPGVSNPQRSGTPDVFRPQIQKDLFGDAGALITQASAIHNQRLDSKAKVASAIPDLVKGLGREGTLNFLSSVFGQDVDLSVIEKMVQNEAMQSDYDTKVKEIETNIASKYGDKIASNTVALQEQTFNKYAAEIGSMASHAKVNEAEIEKLASEYVRNLADALKLKKEGDYYVAQADYLGELEKLTHQSVNRAVFENAMIGVGSDVEGMFNRPWYQGKLKKAYEIDVNEKSALLIRVLDKVLGEYIHVNAGATFGTYQFDNGKQPAVRVGGFR